MPPKIPSQPQELTRAEISQLKALLSKLRDELYAKEVARKTEGAYEISRDDISDETDLASVETDQEVNMKLAEADRAKISYSLSREEMLQKESQEQLRKQREYDRQQRISARDLAYQQQYNRLQSAHLTI